MGDDGGAGRVKPEFGRVQDSDERVPDRVAVAVDNGEWGDPCCSLVCGTTHCYRGTVRSSTVLLYGTVLLLWLWQVWARCLALSFPPAGVISARREGAD